MKFPAIALAFVLGCMPTIATAADWSPQQWVAEDTLQFRSECPDESEHWSYVWLVVLDGDVWVRLGGRAGARVDCNKTKPITSIKIADQVFDNIEMVNSPEMVERVAAAMAEKYSTDIFVRYMAHPYTMKVAPAAGEAVAPSAAAAPAVE